MAWERGAWEKRTSNPYSYGSYGTNTKRDDIVIKSGKTSNKSNKRKSNPNEARFKKNLGKFLSDGWKISQKKKKQYLDNNYESAPYWLNNNDEIAEKVSKLITSKSNESKFLVICDDEVILNEILLELNIKGRNNVFKSYNSINQLDRLIKNIEEFKKTNNNLFNKYSLKIFNDAESAEIISDLKILSQDVHYIGNKEAKILNDFVKIYWDYYELSNFSNIDLALAERDIGSEISAQVNDLKITQNYVKRLEKILNVLNVNIDDLNEFDIELLKNNPSLINIDEAEEFLSILDDYQKINISKKLATPYFDNFTSNEYILGILANYQRFVDGEESYNKINKDILDLKNQLKINGINVLNLNDYLKIKDNLKSYSNVFVISKSDYKNLKDKLNEFLKHNLSFSDYLNNCKKNAIFNLDSNSFYIEINKAIENIIKVCSNMGMNIDSLTNLDNHKDDFLILSDYANLSNNESESNELNLSEYAKSLFDDLKEISSIITSKSKPIFDITDLDLIKYNFNILMKSIDNLGLKIHNFQMIEDNFSKIVNMEKDTTDMIFSPQTNIFLQKDQPTIHAELDNLKDSFYYLMDKLEGFPQLIEGTFDNFNDLLAKQYKLDFFIANIEDLIDSSNSFESILENYNMLIQTNINLANESNLFEFKEKLDNLRNEFNSIETANNNGQVSISNDNQGLINNINSYEKSINEKFNQLLNKGNIDSNKLKNCDIKSNIDELNKNLDIAKDFIKYNQLSDISFRQIISDNEIKIKDNDDIKSKIENANIYNFYEISRKLDLPDYDYGVVNEILDIALTLKLDDYAKFQEYTLEDIINFSRYLDNSREYSKLVESNLLSNDFSYSETNFNNINLKIKDIEKQLSNLNLDASVLVNFSQIDMGNIGNIKGILNKVNELLKIKPSDMDIKINNCVEIIDNLLKLTNDQYIEFEIDEHKFTSRDFKLNLDAIQEELETNIMLLKLEDEISKYHGLIENNLSEIWNGPLTDIDIIKNKFNIDQKFSELYNKGIFSSSTLDNMGNISESDLIFLNDLKNNKDSEFTSKCKLFYKNNELLHSQLEILDNLNKDDLNSILSIFVNINKIFKSRQISECITLLEYNIKHDNAITLINEYEAKLKPFSVIYYKYFNKREFNIPIDDLNDKLDLHFKYSQIVDSQIISKEYLKYIEYDFDDFSSRIEKLEELRLKIVKDSKRYFGTSNISFKNIEKEYEEFDKAGIVLLNFNSISTSLNNDYSNYFDYVYIVDNDSVSLETKLHLFLISKNKLSILKLKDW